MHSSSLSQSSLPHSLSNASSSSRRIHHHPSIDITPWIIYEHAAPDADLINSKLSENKSLRVVGRGGFGSRPQRSRTLSSADVTSTPEWLPQHIEVTQALQRSPSEPQTTIRIVGRGGFGSKRRKATDVQPKTNDTPSSPPISNNENLGGKIVRISGRGGAGSQPRIFQPNPNKEKRKRFRWIDKGKAKLFPSKPPTLPVAESESDDDDGSVRFAPIAQPSPTRHKSSASETPSLASTSDCAPSASATTSMSGASSSDFDSSLRMNGPRKLYKLYHALGEHFPEDIALISTIQPVRSPSPRLSLDETSYNDDYLKPDHLPSDTTSIHSRHKSGFSVQSPTSKRGSTFMEVYMDDRYDSASFMSVTSPLSPTPMTFFEPPVKPIQSSTSELPGDNGAPYVPEEIGGERPDSPFSQYSLASRSTLHPHVVHSTEAESAEGWSGTWNSDMRHVIDSLRLLRECH